MYVQKLLERKDGYYEILNTNPLTLPSFDQFCEVLDDTYRVKEYYLIREDTADLKELSNKNIKWEIEKEKKLYFGFEIYLNSSFTSAPVTKRIGSKKIMTNWKNRQAKIYVDPDLSEFPVIIKGLYFPDFPGNSVWPVCEDLLCNKFSREFGSRLYLYSEFLLYYIEDRYEQYKSLLVR